MKRIIGILFLALTMSSYGQTYPDLEKALTKELSENSDKDGRWVFYSAQANIQKIDKPLVKARFLNYDFFQVDLTNYMGYHVNQGTCLILFDSLKSKIILVDPLWYGGVSERLFNLCIGEKFENRDSLINFMNEFMDLMEVGSGYKFFQTSYSDSLITYDLGYFEGDSYTTGEDETSTTLRYNQDGVWRNVELEIKGLTIIGLTSTNPKTKDNVKVKN